jgi:DNA-binding NarL/FixJ family response regulator
MRYENNIPMPVKVYIVEDSELIRQRIDRMISSVEDIEIAGYSDNINEAIDSIKHLKPHVVILDISVEKVKGLKMIFNIKQIKPAPQVIMFTNYDFENYREKSFEYGADYYLDKSNEFEKITTILEKVKRYHKVLDLIESL